MPRRHPFTVTQRPVLSTPHGGVMHHGWDWVVAHKVLVEALGVVLGAALLFAVLTLAQSWPTVVDVAPNAAEVYRDLHSYDAIENLRAARLLNPRPIADRGYDAIENLRAERLLLQGDRSYDAIEAIRAARLINPVATPDHSYDALEALRATRDLGR